MATRNPRINITFEQAYSDLLASLAEQEKKSVSSLAKELILEALERREDLALSELAEARDSAKEEKIQHEDAWK